MQGRGRRHPTKVESAAQLANWLQIASSSRLFIAFFP
jgi:hypothetical protein